LKYFVEKPPLTESMKKIIARQSADAKRARAKRTQGGGNNGGKSRTVAKKTAAVEASQKSKVACARI
jgi:hypothetical protein